MPSRRLKPEHEKPGFDRAFYIRLRPVGFNTPA